MYVNESLCCTAETNNTVNQLYFNKKFFLKRMKLEKWWSKELQIPPPQKNKEKRHKLSESTFLWNPQKLAATQMMLIPTPFPTHPHPQTDSW